MSEAGFALLIGLGVGLAAGYALCWALHHQWMNEQRDALELAQAAAWRHVYDAFAKKATKGG